MANRNTSNVNVGTGPNTNTGETLREAFVKINENFVSLYRNGQFLANATSSASVPTYSFENDKDTGLYNPSPGIVGVALNGQEFLLMKVTGEITWRGKELPTKEYVDTEIAAIGAGDGILGIPVVDTLPNSGNFAGRLVLYNLDNETYIYLNDEWILYKNNIIPEGPSAIQIVNELPGDSNWTGRSVILTDDNSIYIYESGEWKKIIKLYTPMANGFTSIDVVTSLPSSNLFNGRQVLFNDQVYLYNSTASEWRSLSNYVSGVTANTLSYVEIVSTTPTTNNFAGRFIIQGNTEVKANALVYTQTGYVPLANFLTVNAIISANTIFTAALQSLSVTGEKIAENSITSVKVADNSITTSALVNESVTSNKLASNAVTSAKINANAINTVNINDDAITTSKIAANTITTSKIENASITTEKIVANAITTAKIADAAVTTPKIAANSITTEKIENGSVTLAKISSATISSITSSVNSSLSLERQFIRTTTQTNIPIINRKYSNSTSPTTLGWTLSYTELNPANYNFTDNLGASSGANGQSLGWVDLVSRNYTNLSSGNNYKFTAFFKSGLSINTTALDEGNPAVGEGGEAFPTAYIVLYRIRYTPAGTTLHNYSEWTYSDYSPEWWTNHVSSYGFGKNISDNIHFQIVPGEIINYVITLQAASVRLISYINYNNQYIGATPVFRSTYQELGIIKY